MIQKQTFHYKSSDGIHNIHASRWLPETTHYKGIVQIVHGMAEFIDRYDDFARFLCSRGYIVVGEDHLGHGDSVTSPEEWGYFGARDGFAHIIADLHKLHKRQAREFPSLPYFMLGHSMGSFLTRIYISRYGNELSGTIIMGTGGQPVPLVMAGKTLASLIGLIKGKHFRSNFINSLAFGSYNKSFAPARTPYDWLTKDKTIVDRYCQDPRCTFTFTVSAYKELFSGILYVSDKKNIAKIPKDLPVMITSGAQDPVGDFGKGVRRVYHMFKNAGIRDLSVLFYENGRHEILNETERAQVYADMAAWLKMHT